MVKLLKAEFGSLHFEKHKGSTGGLRTTNANHQRHSYKNIASGPNERQYLETEKMTERMAMVDDRLDTGELKRFGKTQSRWWKQRYNWGDVLAESEEMQIEALKEAKRS